MNEFKFKSNTETFKLASHVLQETTYFNASYCEFCKKLLKGMIKQGLKCQECGINVHKQCSKLISLYCRDDTQLQPVRECTSINLSEYKNCEYKGRRNAKIKREKFNSVTISVDGIKDCLWRGYMVYSTNLHQAVLTRYWQVNRKSIVIYDSYKIINKLLEIPLTSVIKINMCNDNDNLVSLNDGNTHKYIFKMTTNDTVFYCGYDYREWREMACNCYGKLRLVIDN